MRENFDLYKYINEDWSKYTDEELSAETGFNIISVKEDNLPFFVLTVNPDDAPAHAHLVDLETGTKDIYQFLLTDNMPTKPSEIKTHKHSLGDDDKQLLCDWFKQKNKMSLSITANTAKALTNWEMLKLSWHLIENSKWHPTNIKISKERYKN